MQRAPSSRFFYGWVIVAVAFLMNVASSPLNAAVFSFFVTPLQEELGWSLSSISLGFTLRMAVAGISGPFVGILLDNYGARVLGAVAGLLAGLTVIGLSMADSLLAYYILFTISGFSGFGAPTGQLLSTVPVSKWFQANRGRPCPRRRRAAPGHNHLYPHRRRGDRAGRLAHGVGDVRRRRYRSDRARLPALHAQRP